jgi:hypothetical protein
MHRVPILCFVALLFVPNGAWAQGEPLGPEFQVNSYTTSHQRYVSMASDSAGNFVVVWTSANQDGSYGGVFGQRYDSTGTPLDGEFRVNSYTTSYQRFPSVASDSAGNFVVVWQSYGQDGYHYGIFGQRYASTGAPLGEEFRVNTYTTNNQRLASVASDSAGNFVVAWTTATQDGHQVGVFAQRYATTGAPLGGEFQVNTYTTFFQWYPSVAFASGNESRPSWRPRAFVVVWTSANQDGSDRGIFGQRYASTGTPLGGEFRVNSYTTGSQYSPQVASDSAGNFVVIWTSAGQYTRDVFGQRYASTGAPLGGEFRVNSYTTHFPRFPSVASDSAGNFVVAWRGLEGRGNAGIFGQRYASTGEPLGGEFRVNSYTYSAQYSPEVASGSAGNFVVVWQSYTQDGDGYGVFAQRYSAIVP